MICTSPTFRLFPESAHAEERSITALEEERTMAYCTFGRVKLPSIWIGEKRLLSATERWRFFRAEKSTEWNIRQKAQRLSW